MKKFLILFLMSLSLVACGSGGSDSGDSGSGSGDSGSGSGDSGSGSGGSDDGNNDDGGGGGGGVVKPTSISASPMVATVGVQTRVDFTIEPPESIDSCAYISLQNCDTLNVMHNVSGFTFTPAAEGICNIVFACGGDLYTIDIQIIPEL